MARFIDKNTDLAHMESNGTNGIILLDTTMNMLFSVKLDESSKP